MEWKEENIYFTETCSGSEVGSYLRLIDCVYHSTLGLRVGKKKKKEGPHENSRKLKQRNQISQAKGSQTVWITQL